MKWERVVDKAGKELARDIIPFVTTAYADGQRIASAQLDLALDPDIVDKYAKAYVPNATKLLVKNITSADKKIISHYLKRAVDEGWPRTKFIAALRNSRLSFTIPRYRAERIWRTEKTRAQINGAMDRYKEAGIKKAQFMAHPDACPICAILAGTEMPLDEARGKIPVHPNCRCGYIPVIKEIPKPERVRFTFEDRVKVDYPVRALGMTRARVTQYKDPRAPFILTIEKGAKFGRDEVVDILNQYPRETLADLRHIIIRARERVRYIQPYGRIAGVGIHIPAERMIVLGGNFPDRDFLKRALHHEIAHHMDDVLSRNPNVRRALGLLPDDVKISDYFHRNVDITRPPTEYARVSMGEDFAESWSLYAIKFKNFKRKWPNRFNICDRLNDIIRRRA